MSDDMPNRDRIGAALEVMKLALRPYVEKQLHIAYGEHWVTSSLSALPKRQESISRPDQWDIHLILAIIWNNWNGVFSSRLGRMERTFISELQEVRNRWAHQGQFDDEDTFRALGTMEKLLRAVSAKEVTDIQRLKTEAMQFLSKNLDNSVRISRVNEVPTGEPSSYHVYINTKPTRRSYDSFFELFICEPGKRDRRKTAQSQKLLERPLTRI